MNPFLGPNRSILPVSSLYNVEMAVSHIMETHLCMYLDKKSRETGETLDSNHVQIKLDQIESSRALRLFVFGLFACVFCIVLSSLRAPRCSFVWRETSLDHTLIPYRALLSVCLT